MNACLHIYTLIHTLTRAFYDVAGVCKPVIIYAKIQCTRQCSVTIVTLRHVSLYVNMSRHSS